MIAADTPHALAVDEGGQDCTGLHEHDAQVAAARIECAFEEVSHGGRVCGSTS